MKTAEASADKNTHDTTVIEGAAAPAVAAVAVETASAEPDSGLDQTGRPWKRVDLDNPLKRAGAPDVNKVVLRKPMGGDLRGTKLVDVYNMDVVAISIIVPRISDPIIHRPEFMAMHGEDIASLSSEVVGFLLTKSQKSEAGLSA